MQNFSLKMLLALKLRHISLPINTPCQHKKIIYPLPPTLQIQPSPKIIHHLHPFHLTIEHKMLIKSKPLHKFPKPPLHLLPRSQLLHILRKWKIRYNIMRIRKLQSSSIIIFPSYSSICVLSFNNIKFIPLKLKSTSHCQSSGPCSYYSN